MSKEYFENIPKNNNFKIIVAKNFTTREGRYFQSKEFKKYFDKISKKSELILKKKFNKTTIKQLC